VSLVSFRDLMADAERGRYAVGYFESWDQESLLAVADAAEAARSPVLLGFSGIYLLHPGRRSREHLGDYAALGLEVCRRLEVPACLVFNESPHFEAVLEAARLGFGLVMFSDERLGFEEQAEQVARAAEQAHREKAAVEGEMTALPGMAGELGRLPEDLRLSDPDAARRFAERTGVDALAVNIGQAHLHGRREVRLNLERLAELRRAVGVPLVLHGASSVIRQDLEQAVASGIRKINVGSVLKRTYFETLRGACLRAGKRYNPYEVVGSGLPADVLTSARLSLQKTVEDLLGLIGSAGRG
jgi:fructose/tagatose bisphosphate aldolase